jgi:hypothetical protein
MSNEILLIIQSINLPVFHMFQLEENFVAVLIYLFVFFRYFLSHVRLYQRSFWYPFSFS